jgi:hypothetical protein
MATEILQSIAGHSARYGTTVEISGGIGVIEVK